MSRETSQNNISVFPVERNQCLNSWGSNDWGVWDNRDSSLRGETMQDSLGVCKLERVDFCIAIIWEWNQMRLLGELWSDLLQYANFELHIQTTMSECILKGFGYAEKKCKNYLTNWYILGNN